jgi:hypothetical protein
VLSTFGGSFLGGTGNLLLLKYRFDVVVAAVVEKGTLWRQRDLLC